MEDIKLYLREVRRIIKIAKKPSWQEVINTFKISLLFSFLIGFIGLVIHLIFTFLY